MEEFLSSIGYRENENGKWVHVHSEHGESEEKTLEEAYEFEMDVFR